MLEDVTERCQARHSEPGEHLVEAVRSAASVTAADNLGTPHELQVLFGWRKLKLPESYPAAASRKRLAPASGARADREQKSLTPDIQAPPTREKRALSRKDRGWWCPGEEYTK